MNFYNSIGLIGSGGTSFGCGILIVYKGKSYVLTCDHILNELTNSDNLWFQFHLMKTKFPVRGFLRYPFNISQRIPLSDIAMLQTEAVSDGEYLNFHSITQVPGDQLNAFGYPVFYAANELNRNSNEPLYPFKLKGIFVGFQNHFTLNNREGDAIVKNVRVGLIETESRDFEGYSGGLVTDQHCRPVGMIVGENGSHIIFVHFWQLYHNMNDSPLF